MLKRILINDIGGISDEEVALICKLVAYHDLIGDILCNGRNEQELFNLIENEQELIMLIALSLADISAISHSWSFTVNRNIANLEKKVKANI